MNLTLDILFRMFEPLYGYSYIGNMLTWVGLRAGGELLQAYNFHNLSASVSKDAWTLTFSWVSLLSRLRDGAALWKSTPPALIIEP